MHLTLFTDASFDNYTGAGGWGAWAKKDGWAAGVVIGGPFQKPMDNNHEAELAAMVNALHCLHNTGHLVGVDTVMIQSDSHRALYVLVRLVPETKISNHPDGVPLEPGTKLSKVTPLEKKAAELLTALKWEAKVQLIARHVKGHQPGSKRQWVNRQCDTVARKHMIAMKSGLPRRKKAVSSNASS